MSSVSIKNQTEATEELASLLDDMLIPDLRNIILKCFEKCDVCKLLCTDEEFECSDCANHICSSDSCGDVCVHCRTLGKVCSDCKKECTECGCVSCESHMNNQCGDCEEGICEECSTLGCEECGSKNCFTCTNYCQTCGDSLCKQCIYNCSVCGLEVCKTCQKFKIAKGNCSHKEIQQAVNNAKNKRQKFTIASKA